MSVVETLLHLDGSAPIADLFFADSPAFLIEGDGGDVVMANPAAAAFVRADQLSDLIDGTVRLRGPANARLAELARLDDLSNTARIEMLRFFVGARAVTLPFMCQRAGRPAPQPNVFAIAAAPPASDLSVADKAAIAFDDDRHPVVLYSGEGELVYANAAARDGDIGTAEDLAGVAAITRIVLDDGDLVLFCAEPGTAMVAPPPPPAAPVPRAPAIEDLPPRAQAGMTGIGGAARDVLRGLGAQTEDLFSRTAPVSSPQAAAARPQAHTAADESTGGVAVPEGTRFRFTLDAEACISDSNPPLAGIGLLGNIGDSLDDLLTGDLGELVDAIESRDTFNDVVVLWRTLDGGDPAAVTIAGLPLLDGQGGYGGLRGFSVVGERRPAPEPAPVAVEETAEDRRDGPVAADDDDLWPEDEGAFEPDTSHTAHKPVPDVMTAGPESGGLDAADQRAFREIAQRLNERPGHADQRPTARSAEGEAAGPATEARATGEDAAESKTLPPQQATRIYADDDPNVIRATPPGAAGQRALQRGRAQDANDFIGLIDRLPFGLMFVRDEKPLYANRAMLDLFGYADLDDLEIAGGLHTLFENLENTREPGKRMLAGVTRDGLPIELDARLQLAPWIDGPALLLSARERISGDDERIGDLEAEVVELKDILDTATDGILLLDNDGDILALNHSAEALFGLEGREVRGSAFAELFPEGDREVVADYLEGLQGNGVASVLNDGREIRGLAKGGGRIPLSLTIGRVGIGRRQKFCAVLRDITQWKRNETELVAARREAEATASQKSDVLAKVSHEVRTPLNAIIGFADVMLEEQFGPIGNERYRGYLHDIKSSGEHIISLVNDLLDLSKVEAGMMDMDFTKVHLNDVVEQCVAIMQGQANRERVILRTSLAPSLPDIVADLRSIRQILLNLISNAVKFTPSAGQIIVSTVYTEGGEVLLRVRDTGMGMSDEDISSALEPYRQTQSTRAQKTGTGIGLPLTKALTEANRASFSIESKLDSGTLVQITFPSTRVLAE